MNALRFVDLSRPIRATTPIYRGDPMSQIDVYTTIESIGCNLFGVQQGSPLATNGV